VRPGAAIAALLLALALALLTDHGRDQSVVSAAPSRGLRVVATGDIACLPGHSVTATKCRHGDVAALAKRLGPKFFLMPGDIQYDRGALAAFQQSFGAAFADLKRTWRPAPGNHEYMTAGAAGYFDFFGAAAGPGRRGWYSWNAGGWHFVSLNSVCDRIDCTRDSPQVRWLRADLRRSRAQCTIAYFHHPLVSSGLHGDNPGVASLWHELDRDGVELVIAGHDHSYERFVPLGADGRPKRGGVREFVVGTGGASLYPIERPGEGSVVSVSTFGVLALDLARDRYSWRYMQIDGKVLDSGRVRCR
jgi:3',5'-cyclic AMP phosphodiesterase CpdA